jgi:putative heme transporter
MEGLAGAQPRSEGTRPKSGEEHPRWHLVLQTVAIVSITLGVAVAIYLQHPAISAGLRQIGSLRWRWVVVGSLSELLSMLALALLYRDLLRANQIRLGVSWIMACCFASNAISVSVPVIGSGIASRRTFRRFRQGGADATTASFALTVGGVVSTVTMATVIAAGAVLSGNPAAAVSGVAGAVVMLAAAVALGLGLRSEKGSARLRRLMTAAIAGTKRLTRHPKGEPKALAENALGSLQRMHLGTRTTARVVLWGLLNWWADVACLLFTLWAVHIIGLPIGKVLLVWVAGEGAASLSPTPGGIGAVEVTMVAALAAFGVRGPDAILAILVYRLITFKVIGSFWAVIYEFVDRHRQRGHVGGQGVTI